MEAVIWKDFSVTFKDKNSTVVTSTKFNSRELAVQFCEDQLEISGGKKLQPAN